MSFPRRLRHIVLLALLTAALPAVDAPPTIATAALASPATVTGKTTKLTVLGADDGGAAALIYTWAASGPGAVTFSANGTNAAKAVTATFPAPGDYTCTVTITDAGGQSVSSATPVQVVSTLTTLTISPTTAVVNPTATKPFIAAPKNQFGTALVGEPLVWNATGGSVDQTGVFTAGATPGPATVMVTDGPKTATATIRVNAAPTVTLPPIAAVVGTTVVLAASGSDPDDAASTLKYTWTASATTVSFSPNGTTASANTTATFRAAGTYTLTVTVRDSAGATAMATQPVVVQATPTTVVVSPNAAATVVNPGATKTFTATVKDQFAAVMTGMAATWSVVPPAAGAITSAGVLTGGTPTLAATVTAAVGTASGSAPVRVNAPPTITTPVSTTAANPLSGLSAVFTVQGGDDINPLLLSYAWSATGPKAVAFVPKSGVNDTTTTATFAAVGSYSILATIRDQQGLTTTSTLPFTVAPVTTVASLSPASAVVLVGAKKSFTAQLRDQFGAVIGGMTPTIVSATATGGTVTFSGATATFIAGTAGDGTVSVILAGTPALSATAGIQITTSYTLGQPSVVPAAGTSGAPFVAQVSDADTNVTALRYRTDGATPTAADPIVPAGGVPVGRSLTLTVRAFGPSPWQPSAVATMPYVLQVQGVTPSVPGGTYTAAQNVTLVSASVGAQLVYTLDGSDPLSSATAVHASAPATVAIARSAVLTAVATLPGWSPSTPLVVDYQIIQPPIITAGPSATPAAVTGTSTVLAVTASDPQGLALSYQWSGDASVGFNDATGAGTNATFTAPGTYPLHVTVSNVAGLSASGSVSVTVTTTPTVLTIAPPSASVVAGQTQAFTASAADQFGQPIAVTPMWSCAGSGTIGQTGLFTAGTGAGTATVTAQVGGLQAQAAVTVMPAYQMQLRPTTAAPNPGATVLFTAVVVDATTGQPMTPQPSVAWSINGGGTIDATGLWTAGPTAGGPYRVTATATVGVATVTGTVDVQINAPPTIAVAPVTDGTAGPVIGLSVLGADDGGEANLTYAWTQVDGPAVVSFPYANGTNLGKALFATFPRAGTYDLIVTSTDAGGLSVSAPLQVVYAVQRPSVPDQGYACPSGQSVLEHAVTVVYTGADPVSLAIGEPPQHGSISLTTSGTFRYTPTPGYSGSDHCTVVATAGTIVGRPGLIGIAVGSDPTRSPLTRANGIETFDPIRWATDPVYETAYGAGAIPGRVWVTARGAAGVPMLNLVVPAHLTVAMRGHVTLTCRGQALAPVSFAVAANGTFPGGGTAITVVADAQGVASTTFTAPAVPCLCPVLIGSPLAVGTQHLVVEVTP